MFVKQNAGMYLIELVIMAVLTAAACFVPLGSLLCAVLLPVFFVMLTACRPARFSIVHVVLLVGLAVTFSTIRGLFALTTVMDAVLFAMSLSASGIAMGLLLKRGQSLYQIVGAGAGVHLLVILLQIGKYKWLDGVDFMETFVNQPIRAFVQFYQTQCAALGQPYTGIADMLGENIWLIQQAIGAMIPACLLIFSLYLTYFVFLLARKLLFCGCHKVFPDVAHFWEVQCSRYVAAIFAAALLLSSLLGMSQAGNAALNLALVLGSAIVLCGLSAIDFYFRRTRLVCGLRAVVYIVGFFVLSLLTAIIPVFRPITVLVLLGLLDSFLNIRKLRRKEADIR